LNQTKLNKSRADFIELVVLGLISSRSVHFGQIADKMLGEADTESKHRQIQHFVGEYSLDYDWIALFLILLLPKHGKVKICIDSTTWESSFSASFNAFLYIKLPGFIASII